MNITIFQFFHWYFPADGDLWNHASEQAQRLADLGITHIWLPPAYKSAGGTGEPGYAVYDLYDLGEFDQKNTVRTKYGTKDEYLQCIKAIHDRKMGVLADIVLNHKLGGDEKEDVPVQQVNKENRLEKISGQTSLKAYTLFTFPGRNGKYSDYIWDWHSFSGVSKGEEIYIILNEHTNGEWENVMERQYGNFDYLMGCDIEYRNPAVREELKRWGKWYIETTGVDGFRLDAVKHIAIDFFPEWLPFLKASFQRDLLCIGEYWKADINALLGYIDATGGMIQLFDVPLHFNFYKASKAGKGFDLRTIFDDTLVKARPELAITFVDNHDTQPLQSLESWVEPWFKPHAYAMILLREQGIPSVFYPALYGAGYSDTKNEQQFDIHIPPTGELETLIRIRSAQAYGEQYDYLDDPGIIGWTRTGRDDKPGSGCAVLLTNAGGGEKWMNLGKRNAGKILVNALEDASHEITLNEKGDGLFNVAPGKVSVWVFKNENKN